eukprot:635826-Amphidinium_carterae.1
MDAINASHQTMLRLFFATSNAIRSVSICNSKSYLVSEESTRDNGDTIALRTKAGCTVPT